MKCTFQPSTPTNTTPTHTHSLAPQHHAIAISNLFRSPYIYRRIAVSPYRISPYIDHLIPYIPNIPSHTTSPIQTKQTNKSQVPYKPSPPATTKSRTTASFARITTIIPASHHLTVALLPLPPHKSLITTRSHRIVTIKPLLQYPIHPAPSRPQVPSHYHHPLKRPALPPVQYYVTLKRPALPTSPIPA